MSNPIPSVGRIVHYVSHGTPVRPDGTQAFDSRNRAAVITQVNSKAIDPATMAESDMWCVGLCVLNPTGFFFHESVVQMENAHDGGTWHWPHRGNATDYVDITTFGEIPGSRQIPVARPV